MATVDLLTVYPYVRPTGNPVARPMLLVRVHNPPAKPWGMVAVVDSGADASMFHTSVAIQVGIDLARCRVGTTRGVGGRAMTYLAAVQLEVEGRRFPAEVRFTDSIAPTIALLGRHDVFEQFQFGFDQRARLLLLQPYP